MEADIILKNGRCMTMEKEGEIYDWIAIKGEQIIGMGHKEDYQKMAGAKTLFYDCQETTVLPGFIDSHFHVIQSALNYDSVDLSEAKSFQEIEKAIKQAMKTNPGKGIRGIGLSIDNLEEKCPPTRQILDKFCDDAPLWINSREYQVSMLSTYALLYFKVPFTTEGVEVDSKSLPTGIFRRQANAILRTNILNSISDKNRWDAVDAMMPNLIRNGITTLNAMEGGSLYSDKDAEFILKYSKDFPVDMILFYQTFDVDKILEKGLRRIGGSLYIDGTFGSRTAAISFEYADCPGSRGRLCLHQAELDDFVLECYKKNIQLALYTIGDRAIEAALQAHEKAVGQIDNRRLRHRLEHVELPDSNQIRRAKELGIIFSVQPSYEYYWGGNDKMYSRRLGLKYKNTNPYRELLDCGMKLCGGSDSDVTEPKPMLGIHSAVNRYVENHNIRLYEALKLFTLDGAFAVFEENEKGSLKTGKIADIVVLDKNLEKIDKNKLKDVNVKLTIKSGVVIYSESDADIGGLLCLE